VRHASRSLLNPLSHFFFRLCIQFTEDSEVVVGLVNMPHSHELRHRLRGQLRNAEHNRYRPRTLASRDTAMRRFREFTREADFAAPYSTRCVQLFATYLVVDRAILSVENYTHMVVAELKRTDAVDEAFDRPAVMATLAALVREHQLRAGNLRFVITREHLEKIAREHDATSERDARCFAAVLFGFMATLRVSEYALSDATRGQPAKWLRQSDIVRKEYGLQLMLRWTKSRQDGQVAIKALVRTNTSLCPVRAYDRFLALRTEAARAAQPWLLNVPHDVVVKRFDNATAFETASGGKLTASAVNAFLQRFLPAGATSHALRRGSAVELGIVKDVGEPILRASGLWSSDVWQRYVAGEQAAVRVAIEMAQEPPRSALAHSQPPPRARALLEHAIPQLRRALEPPPVPSRAMIRHALARERFPLHGVASSRSGGDGVGARVRAAALGAVSRVRLLRAREEESARQRVAARRRVGEQAARMAPGVEGMRVAPPRPHSQHEFVSTYDAIGRRPRLGVSATRSEDEQFFHRASYNVQELQHVLRRRPVHLPGEDVMSYRARLLAFHPDRERMELESDKEWR